MAVTGAAANYPSASVTKARQEAESPEEYLQEMPEVTALADGLRVAVPEGTGTDWSYEAEAESMTVRGNAAAATFDITGLPAGESYTLTLTGTDGRRKLPAVTGRIEEGSAAEAVSPALDEMQQRLADLMQQGE